MEFKVGQKVFSIMSGWGVVVDIDNNNHRPIVCTFYKGDAERFHYNGKAESDDLIPTLYHDEMRLENGK